MMLIVREDLGMSVGKTGAQCAHAAVGLVQKLQRRKDVLLRQWDECGQTKIVLKCSNLEEMMDLVKKARCSHEAKLRSPAVRLMLPSVAAGGRCGAAHVRCA